MKIKTKLIGAFVVVCLIGLIASVVGIVKMEQINDTGQQVYKFDLLGLSLTKEANIELISVGRSMRNALLANTAAQRESAIAQSEKSLALVRSYMDKAKPLY